MEITVQNINEIINYQEGSVVSKVLLKKETGNVTLFAFDENQGLSEHTTPFDAMVQIVDGEAEITIGGEVHIVKKDEFIIMPANVPHALKAIKKYKMILTMIKTQNNN